MKTIAFLMFLAQGAPPADFVVATVDRVIDGDTIKTVEFGSVRLADVDTPETKHPKLKVQRCGPEATDFTRTIVRPGQTLMMLIVDHDRYKRPVAYVWVIREGTNHSEAVFLNFVLVDEGLARVDGRWKRRWTQLLLEVQAVARADERRIWYKGECCCPSLQLSSFR